MNTVFPFHKKCAVAGLLALACMFTPSCRRDLLELAPEDRFSESTVFDTPDRIEKLRNGLYDAVKNGNFLGALYIVFSDARAEEFLDESGNLFFVLGVWNHTENESFSQINRVWNAGYFAINSCNIFIKGVQANRQVLGNDQLALQYEAEARFLRALSYYSLMTLYARPYTDGNGNQLGLVLRLGAEPGASPKDLARASGQEMYDQILSDLDFAVQNLPLDYGDDFQNTTYAHRNTAIALKTRVLLTMGRYAELIAEADRIVPPAAPFVALSGVLHALQDDVRSVFEAPYLTPENIFSLPFTGNDPALGQTSIQYFYNPAPAGNGDASLNPGGILGDSVWATGDVRRQAFVFYNPVNGKPYLSKFPNGNPGTDFIPVIRYAEVLLNLSEALARTTGITQRAVDLLNAVRGRSNSAGVYALSDFTNADALIQAILKERRIELLGEGFRPNDCLRLLLPIPAKANVPAIQPGDGRYIWPIPSSEISVNTLCEQNPGY